MTRIAEISVRLRCLAKRREDEGIYTDAALCTEAADLLTTPANPAQVTDAQIEHMVQRFLGWRLPETFGPDAGIRFERVANAGTPYEHKHEPVGTNLFDYTEAKAMVLHMLEELPAAIGAGGQAVASCLSPAPVQEAVAWQIGDKGAVYRTYKEARRHTDAWKNQAGGPCAEPRPIYASPAPQAPGVSEAMVETLRGIRDAINHGLTENGLPNHRIKLTDGSWLEGRAAEDWRNMLVAFRDIANSALEAAPAGGEWRLVPVEPTEAMLKAAFEAANAQLVRNFPNDHCRSDEERSAHSIRPIYRAMLSASPAKEERSS